MSNPDVVRSDDPDEIRNDIERTRRELGQDVDALADKVNPTKIAHRQSDKMRRAATRLKDRVMGSASDVVDDAQSAVGHAGDAVADAPRKVASATQGNPIAVGLIAFGVGLLAASLIPASRQEQEAAEKVKDAAAPVVEKAKDVAMESADHLREPAREAGEAVKERAAEAVDTVKTEGQDAASEVQTDAKHAADRQIG
jgi:gas vesicle protein